MEENIKMGDRIKWTIVNNLGNDHRTGYGTFVKRGNISGFLVEITRNTDGSFKRDMQVVPTEYDNHHKIVKFLFVDKVERFSGHQGRKWGTRLNKETKKFSSITNEKKVKTFPTKAFVEYTNGIGSKKIEAITNLKTMPIKIQELVDRGAQKDSVKVYEVGSVKMVEFTSHVTVKVL